MEEVKPKRKRRTKAEMEAARAVEAAIKNTEPLTKERLEALAPVITEEIDKQIIEELEKTKNGIYKRGSSKSPKHLQEDLLWLIGEMQGLRQYVTRLEDYLMVQQNKETNMPEPIPTKKKRRSNISEDTQ